MARHIFSGTGVALVTPFRNDYSIDFHALENVVDHVITNEVDYIVALGTTGESVTLSKDEKLAVVNYIIEKISNRVPLVIGVGGNNTEAVLSEMHMYDYEGISGILSVAPYYNKPSQEGICKHYAAIASHSPVPVILYNVPGRTGVNIKPETTLRLAEKDNIVAIKEASGDLSQILDIIAGKPRDFAVLSGDDGHALPIISIGGDGVISVIANTLPFEFSRMVNKAIKGKTKGAAKINMKLSGMYDLLFAEGNPAGVKASLNAQNIVNNQLRLPLTSASDNTFQKIKSETEKVKVERLGISKKEAAVMEQEKSGNLT